MIVLPEDCPSSITVPPFILIMPPVYFAPLRIVPSLITIILPISFVMVPPLITSGPPVDYPPEVIIPPFTTIVPTEEGFPSVMTEPVLMISMPVFPVDVPPLTI